MSTARKILIVDDDEDLREPLREQLALHEEFEITVVDSAAACIDAPNISGAKGDLVKLENKKKRRCKGIKLDNMVATANLLWRER